MGFWNSATETTEETRNQARDLEMVNYFMKTIAVADEMDEQKFVGFISRYARRYNDDSYLKYTNDATLRRIHSTESVRISVLLQCRLFLNQFIKFEQILAEYNVPTDR